MTRIGQFPDGAGRYAIRWRKDGKPARAANLLALKHSSAELGPEQQVAGLHQRIIRPYEPNLWRARPCHEHPQHQLPQPRGHVGYGSDIDLVLRKRKPARPSGFTLASPNSWEGHAQRIALGMIR